MKNIKFLLCIGVLFLGLSQIFSPQNVSAEIIDIPLIGHGAFPNAGAWGFAYVKDCRSYGTSYTTYTDDPDLAGGKGPALRPKNMLVYNTDTNQITLHYEVRSGADRSQSRPGTPYHTNAYSYWPDNIYIGLYGSGVPLGGVTMTSGQAGTDDWDLTTFSGTWTLSRGHGLYDNCGGIFFSYSDQYLDNSYGSTHYFQFDASSVLYNKEKFGSSYNIPITVVNGKAFNISIPNSSGKFVGSLSQYGGTISGYVSGSNTILSGTLYNVPNTYTNMTIGSDTIQIRGIDPPTTSPVKVSFY